MTNTMAIMGLNPFRRHRTTVFDVAMVALVLTATAAAVLWAVFWG